MAAPRFAKILAVNVLVLVACVVLLELLFGNWVRPDRLHRLDLIRDRTIRYDASPLYDPPTVVTYTRDRYGLRGRYDSPGAIDVLTVGGSATDQRVIADGATWQDVMAREFAAEGRAVSVVNAGIDGQSTFGHIRNFEEWFPGIPGLRPRFVLFYVGGNDFFKEAGSDYDAVVRDARSNWKLRVRESSALYHTGRKLNAIYRARYVHRLSHRRDTPDPSIWITTPLVTDHAALAARRLANYRERLRVLAARTKEIGATPVFVTQSIRCYRVRADGTPEGAARQDPYDGVMINGVDMFHIMALFGAATMDVCAESGGVCIDAAAEIDWQPGDFYDRIHNTPQGAERLGRYLHARLRTRL